MALYIMLSHFLADFVCQSHEMATKKYNNLNWLLAHVGVYTLVLFLLMWPVVGLYASFSFAVLNGLAHLIVDFVTSKGTHYFFEKKDYHNGFVVVGLDQLIHVSILFLTF